MSGIVKQIIQSYLAAGGAKMDESSYQRYKYAMLLDFVERRQLYEAVNIQISGVNIQSDVPRGTRLHCKYPGCEFMTASMDSAIDHLVTHNPEWFVGGGISQIVKAAGVTC